MLFPKPERRRKSPPKRVPLSEAEFVLDRDRECVMVKLERLGWTTPREPCAGRLTIEHVLRRAGRRVHERRWMVAACLFHNTGGECSRSRDYVRRLLAEMYPPSTDTPEEYGQEPDGADTVIGPATKENGMNR